MCIRDSFEDTDGLIPVLYMRSYILSHFNIHQTQMLREKYKWLEKKKGENSSKFVFKFKNGLCACYNGQAKRYRKTAVFINNTFVYI